MPAPLRDVRAPAAPGGAHISAAPPRRPPAPPAATPAQAPLTDRRLLLGAALLSPLCSARAAAAAAPAAPPPPSPTPTPYQRAASLEYGLLPAPPGGGRPRVRPCQSDVQPNCVSSSSTNDTFAAPLLADPALREPGAAADALEAALLSIEGDARLVAAEELPGGAGVYRRYSMPSRFERDDLEVLIQRQAEGEPLLVTYRSSAAGVRYVYPFTQPLTDGGAQRKRMQALRRALPAWRLTRCDLIECYAE